MLVAGRVFLSANDENPLLQQTCFQKIPTALCVCVCVCVCIRNYKKTSCTGAYYWQNLAFAMKTKQGVLPTFIGQETNEETKKIRWKIFFFSIYSNNS